ncbi:MAG TPA: hypothetical protein VJB12_02505, partial [Candidatus Nanoarchaeia archaeon]|nr:hypothetical protein [Candidatus Nanoarchaeia archaeon]
MPFDMGGVGKKFLILDELDKVRANRERLRKKNHLRKGRSAPRAIERRLEEILSRESVNLSGSNANLSDIYLLADVALDKRSSAQERILDFRYVLERVDLGVQELQVAKRMYGALKDHFYKDALHMKKSGIPEFKRDLNVMSDNLKGGEKEAYWMDHGISSEEEFAAVKAELKFRYDSVKSKGTVEFTWGEKDQIKQEIYRAKIKGIEHVDEVVRKWNAILKRRERYQERRSWKVEHAISTNRIIDEVEGMLDERLRKVTEAKRHQAALEERRMEVLDRAIEGYQKFLSSPDNQAIDVKKLNGLINALTGKNVRTWDKRLNGVQGAIDGIYTLRELEVAKGLVAYEQSKYQRSSRSKSKSQTLDVFNRIQGDLSSRIEAQEKIREDRRMAKYGKTEPKGSFARLDAWAEGYKEQNRIDDVRERRLTIKNEVTKPTGSFKAFNVKAIEYESQEKQRIENIREQRRLAEAVALRRAQETVKLRGELYQANDLVKRVLQEYEMEIVPAHNELKARIQVSSNVNDLLDI